MAPQLLPGLAPLPDFRMRRDDRHPSVRERESIWRAVGERALKRPAITLILCFAVLGAGALGLTQYQRNVDVVGYFRQPSGSTEGFELLQKAFPAGALFPNTVLVDRADGPLRPTDLQRAQEATRVDGVANVSDVTNKSSDGRAATFAVTFADDPFGDPALERADHIRERLKDLDVPGVTALIGDGSAFREEVAAASTRDQKVIIPLVLLVITITLVILLRAIVAPLYLLVTVVASYLARARDLARRLRRRVRRALGRPCFCRSSCSCSWWRWGSTTTSSSCIRCARRRRSTAPRTACCARSSRRGR